MLENTYCKYKDRLEMKPPLFDSAKFWESAMKNQKNLQDLKKTWKHELMTSEYSLQNVHPMKSSETKFIIRPCSYITWNSQYRLVYIEKPVSILSMCRNQRYLNLEKSQFL
jgi:hypothetical protein